MTLQLQSMRNEGRNDLFHFCSLSNTFMIRSTYTLTTEFMVTKSQITKEKSAQRRQKKTATTKTKFLL